MMTRIIDTCLIKLSSTAWAAFAALALTASPALTSCSGHSTAKDGGEGVTGVTVSLAPHAWLVERIGGERVRVNTLMPKGGDPETYDPSISDIRRLSSSDIFMMAGGMEFERGLADKLPESVSTVDLSEGISLIYGTHAGGSGEGDGHSHGIADPHTWSSLRNGKIIAGNIARALAKADPEGEVYYKERLGSLTATLDSLDKVYTGELAPEAGRTFLIWHPSLSYLARDYGLRQQALGAENKEQSVRSLKQLLDSAGVADPIVLFVQPESDSNVAHTMARELNVTTTVVNPLDPDWLGQLTKTLNALK